MKCTLCVAPYSDECDDPRGYLCGMFHCSNCGVMQTGGFPHVTCIDCKGTGIKTEESKAMDELIKQGQELKF